MKLHIKIKCALLIQDLIYITYLKNKQKKIFFSFGEKKNLGINIIEIMAELAS